MVQAARGAADIYPQRWRQEIVFILISVLLTIMTMAVEAEELRVRGMEQEAGGGSGWYNGGGSPCNGSAPIARNFREIAPDGCECGWTPVPTAVPPATVVSTDHSAITDPCLDAVISAITASGAQSFIRRTYDQQQYTSGTTDRYALKFEQTNDLVGSDGNAVPGKTYLEVLPDGTNQVTVKLNMTFTQNTSKEWAAAVILHEMMHGILLVRRPGLNTNQLSHTYMFDNKVPLTIFQSLKEIFPGMNDHEAIALGMDGLTDAYLIDDPTNPGSKTIDPAKDKFAQENYYQNINLAIDTQIKYRTGTSGTHCN